MGQRLASYIACFILGGLLTGCATVLHSGEQRLEISSVPPGAQVSVDHRRVGTSPITVNLERGHSHTLELEKEGYQEASLTTTPEVSGWLAGNALFVLFASASPFAPLAGAFGVMIDLASDGAFHLSPDKASVELQPE